MKAATRKQTDYKDLFMALEKAFAVIEFSMDGFILSANRNYLDMCGYTLQDLVGKHHKMLCFGEYILSSEYNDIWSALKEGRCVTGLYRRKRKDGEPYWAEAVYYPVFSADGTPQKVIAFCLDVSKRMEEASEKASQFAAIDRTFLVAVYNPEGEIVSINENFSAVLGYDKCELAGQKIMDFSALNQVSRKSIEDTWEHITTGHSYSSLIQWTNTDENVVWLESTFIPLFSSSSVLTKVVQISYDVTAKVNREKENAERLAVFSSIPEATSFALVITDNMNRATYINPAFTDLFGYTESEMRGKQPTSIFGPEEKKFLARLREQSSAQSPLESEEIVYCKDGSRKWVSVQSNPVFDSRGKRKYSVTFLVDVTEHKLLEIIRGKALEGMAHDVPREQLFNLLCTEIERVLPEVGVVAYEKEENNHLRLLTHSHPSLKVLDLPVWDTEAARYPSCRAAATGRPVLADRLQELDLPEHVLDSLKEMHLNACLAQPILSTKSTVLGVVTFFLPSLPEEDGFLTRLAVAVSQLCSVIIEREENRTKMRTLSFYDTVTGLPNRDLLIASAEQLLSRSSEHDSMAVLYMNIDRFDHICRSNSLEEGNKVLKIVSQRILENKTGDALAGHVIASEFGVIFTRCNAKQALDWAKKIQNAVGRPIRIDNGDYSLSVSIGISMYPDNGKSVETLLACANESLVQHRNRGNGTISFFSKNFHTSDKTSFSLESRLRKAIEHDELSLHYQPQVYMNSGKLYGVEALCRWHDSKHGFIEPSRFIPLAEESGLIEQLTDWVLRKVCKQLGTWRKQHLNIPTISVNLSAPNFRDFELPDRIVSYLNEHGLGVKDIILELTESVLLDNDPVTMNTIQKAHDMGLALSLDDFGTGYSSLSYLRDLPFSEIKLDQSFVRDLNTTEISQNLSRAVVLIGQSLNLTVLAEGVETQAQYNVLKNQQCHVAQGYLLAKPLPVPELEAWVGDGAQQVFTDQYCLV